MTGREPPNHEPGRPAVRHDVRVRIELDDAALAVWAVLHRPGEASTETERMPGVPFAASMVARDTPWPTSTSTAGTEEESAEASDAEVVYRLPRIDSDDLLLMRFTAPAMGENELIASLFDAMADSLEWVRARVRAEDAEPIGAAQ